MIYELENLAKYIAPDKTFCIRHNPREVGSYLCSANVISLEKHVENLKRYKFKYASAPVGR
jgi:hypothetical protein